VTIPARARTFIDDAAAGRYEALEAAAKTQALTDVDVIGIIRALPELAEEPQVKVAETIANVRSKSAYAPAIEATSPHLRPYASSALAYLLVGAPSGLDVFLRLVTVNRDGVGGGAYRLAKQTDGLPPLTPAQLEALLALADDAAYVELVAYILVGLIEVSERVETGAVAGHAPPFLAGYRAAQVRVQNARAAAGERWLVDPGYDAAVSDLLPYLSLFWYLPAEDTAPLLDAAMVDDNLRICLNAVITGAGTGRPLDRVIVDEIAQVDWMRSYLYFGLRHSDKLDVLAPKWKTQASLALADIAQWFQYTSEGGRADRIEPMAIVPVTGGDVHVFRVQTGSGPWLAAIAGPYPHDGPPEPYGASTGSALEPYASRTPAEHAAAMLTPPAAP
jgi:hypothetical protein